MKFAEKGNSGTAVFLRILRIFQENLFIEHLRVTACVGHGVSL